jgi:hypothetical protein
MNSPICLSSVAPFLNQFVRYKRALNRKYCADAEVLRLFERYIQSRQITGWSEINSLLIEDFLRSHAPQTSYDPRRLGDDVVAVLDALHIADPVLVGHSIAGEEPTAVYTYNLGRAAALIYSMPQALSLSTTPSMATTHRLWRSSEKIFRHYKRTFSMTTFRTSRPP